VNPAEVTAWLSASRRAQGLPDVIEDPAALDRLGRLLTSGLAQSTPRKRVAA